MADRPKIPVPRGELRPSELVDMIHEWAEEQGYELVQSPHGSEYVKLFIQDPKGGLTSITVPNAHRGRRLRRDQVRYVVLRLNANWEEPHVA